MSTKTYNIKAIDNELPHAWMNIAARVTPALQAGSLIRYVAEVEGGKADILEIALDSDHDVLGYDAV